MAEEKAGLTILGKLFSMLLILRLIGVGGFVYYKKMMAPKPVQQVVNNNTGGQVTPAGSSDLSAPEVVDAKDSVGKLSAPVLFVPGKDGAITIELSEYAGYAGFIVANGGMDPNPDSIFTKKYGLKVKLTLSEEDSWGKLNEGKIAGSATTADVLAVYGKQMQAVVPAQIGFSRGADGLVVRSEIRRINELKGKTIAAAQFNESDFLIRYLAQEAGLGVNMLNDLKQARDPEKVNVVYCKDAFAAGDLFLRDVQGTTNQLAGCMTWDPKTTEVAAQSGGKAKVIVTNKNLLVVADVFILNKPWAQANPKDVKGLVAGLLEGNRMVRKDPESYLGIVGKPFKWDAAKTRGELTKVHLSNLPENLAFFGGTMDAAGSFPGIFQMAVLSYGNLIHDPVDSDVFAALASLQALDKEGFGAGDQVQISPIRAAAGGSLETDPLLAKDVRFFFEPNSAKLDMASTDNVKNLDVLKRMLQISPGSTLLLRGHVDNSNVERFRKEGGEAYVREMALKAMELSKNRAAEVKRVLMEKQGIAAERLSTVGRGWEEPISTEMEKNRRVEAQWFTLE